MKNIILKNGFLALDKDFGKFENSNIINIDKIVCFTSYPKGEKRADDSITFNMDGGILFSWKFNNYEDAQEILEEISEALFSDPQNRIL